MISVFPQLDTHKLPATPLVPAAPLSAHVGQDDSGFRQPQPEPVRSVRTPRMPVEVLSPEASDLGVNIDITV